MRRNWMWLLLFALPFTVAAKKKDKPLPMPPLVSHNQPVSKYACIFTPGPVVSEAESVVHYWNVTAYAEYGKDHKRYWSKFLGAFRGGQTLTSHNSESALSGSTIGMMTEEANYGDAAKKCTEWKQEVHEQIQQSQAKK